MAETEKNVGILTELAKIADVIESSHPFAKSTIIFEMDLEDFEFTKKSIPQIESVEDKFRVQISNVEFIYLLRSQPVG
jgi:hypothetical protein